MRWPPSRSCTKASTDCCRHPNPSMWENRYCPQVNQRGVALEVGVALELVDGAGVGLEVGVALGRVDGAGVGVDVVLGLIDAVGVAVDVALGFVDAMGVGVGFLWLDPGDGEAITA